jgi:hypothetical protein
LLLQRHQPTPAATAASLRLLPRDVELLLQHGKRLIAPRKRLSQLDDVRLGRCPRCVCGVEELLHVLLRCCDCLRNCCLQLLLQCLRGDSLRTSGNNMGKGGRVSDCGCMLARQKLLCTLLSPYYCCCVQLLLQCLSGDSLHTSDSTWGESG